MSVRILTAAPGSPGRPLSPAGPLGPYRIKLKVWYYFKLDMCENGCRVSEASFALGGS